MNTIPEIKQQQSSLIYSNITKLETTFENLKQKIHEFDNQFDAKDENHLKIRQQLNLKLQDVKKHLQEIEKAEIEILRAIYRQKSICSDAEINHLKAEIEKSKTNEGKQNREIETLKTKFAHNFQKRSPVKNIQIGQATENNSENIFQQHKPFTFNFVPSAAAIKTTPVYRPPCQNNGQSKFKWNVTNFKNIRERKLLIKSQIYQIFSFELQAQLKLSATHLIVEMRVKSSPSKNHVLPKVTISFCYFDWQKLNNLSISQTQEPFLGGQLQNSFESYCFNFKLNQHLLANFIRNDEITVEFAVENPLLVEIPYSYDGTLVWRIQNFQEKMQMLKDELISEINSPSFYTSCNGFRVRASIVANKIYIDFLTGEFDAKNTQIVAFQIFVYLIHKNQLIELGKKIFPICDIDKNELPNSSRFRKELSTNLQGSSNLIDALFDQDMYYKIIIKNI